MFSFKVLHFFYKNAASLSVFGCTRVETLTPQQLEHLRIEKENREIDRLSFIVVVAGCKKRKKGQTWPTALSGREQNRSWSHVWTWQVYSAHSCAHFFHKMTIWTEVRVRCTFLQMVFSWTIWWPLFPIKWPHLLSIEHAN